MLAYQVLNDIDRALFAGGRMKKLMVWMSVAFVFSVSVLRPIQGQTTEFKAGDTVEVMVNGRWEPASVTGRSGCGGTCGGYYVSQSGGSSYINPGPANIRAATVTPAQQLPATMPAQQHPATMPVQQPKAAMPTVNGAAAAQGQTTGFKVGDSVEALFAGKWYPATVTGRAGCGGTCGPYYLITGRDRWTVNEGPANIRAHTLTPAEQAVADNSAAELAARAKSGNGIGAQYGTREPTACKSRTMPPTSSAVAKQYVLCGMEGFDGIQVMNILTDVNVQVGGQRAFNYDRDGADNQVDVKAQVYDIRGSYKQYSCTKPVTDGGVYLATHNCVLFDQPVATGSCYRDTFADWHCSLTGSRLGSTGVAGQMAPR
jgi:hypothetical protein